MKGLILIDVNLWRVACDAVLANAGIGKRVLQAETRPVSLERRLVSPHDLAADGVDIALDWSRRSRSDITPCYF
jgi:hypothetical protein